MKKRSGFTLIELLIVIGIIAILAGIVIIAVNPTKQFGQANDAQRQSDVNAILNAVTQYAAESRGDVPAFVTTGLDFIVSTGTGTAAATMCDILVPDYIPALPVDPSFGSDGTSDPVYNGCGAAFDIGYEIGLNADGRVQVRAPFAEQNDSDGDGTADPIEITR